MVSSVMDRMSQMTMETVEEPRVWPVDGTKSPCREQFWRQRQ